MDQSLAHYMGYNLENMRSEIYIMGTRVLVSEETVVFSPTRVSSSPETLFFTIDIANSFVSFDCYSNYMQVTYR